MKKFMAEFKEFISRGNVMDLAVGVIIGGAFGAIVTSLCNDIITPVIQLIISKALGVESIDEMTKVLNVGPIAFGNFISAVINFLIMALIIFLMVKGINKLMGRSSHHKGLPLLLQRNRHQGDKMPPLHQRAQGKKIIYITAKGQLYSELTFFKTRTSGMMCRQLHVSAADVHRIKRIPVLCHKLNIVHSGVSEK